MKNIYAIMLLVIFLMGSTGITISKHYCGDKLCSKSWSLLSTDPTSCNMDMPTQSCDKNQKNDQSKKDCCKNIIDNLKIKDSYAGSFFNWTPQLFSLPIINFIISPVNIYSLLTSGFFYNTFPPPADKGITVLVQSFLC